MNRKYISLAAIIGAFILCLIAVPSAFGAGEARFIDPDAIGDDNDGYLTDPTPDEQKWARQGGFIGLMYEDDRLNQPVRRVLIPYLDTTFVVRTNYVVLADIEAHSNTITITVTPTETLALAVNDYVIVGEYAVRKVLEITAPTAPDTDYVVTLDKPFYENASGQIVHKIKPSVIEAASGDGAALEVDWHNNYGLYAKAVELEDAQASLHNGVTRYSVDNEVDRYFADSDIATTSGGANDADAASIERRLTGRGTRRINHSDALIVRVDDSGIPFTETTYTIQDVRDARVEFTATGPDSGGPLGLGDNPDHQNHLVYLAAWFVERNDTGAAIKIRSQAYPTDTTLALRETEPDSGKFALKIQAVKYGAQHPKPVVNPADGVPKLPVRARDMVTVSTVESTGTLAVETSAPSFTGLSPSHNSYGKGARPEVSAQVIDVDSGVTAENIRILFLIEEEGKPARGLVYTPARTGDADEITFGFRVGSRLRGADAPSADAAVSWWIMAEDNAGTVGFSDREPTVNGAPDTCAETSADVGDTDADKTAFISNLQSKKCDPYVVRVDRTSPRLLRAETGRHWDSALRTGDSDDKTEYRVARADKSSVMVVFDSHLEAASVSASDFEVDGSQPLAAVAYNVKVRDDAFSTKTIPDPNDNSNNPKMIEVVDEETGDGNPNISDSSALDVGKDRGYAFLRLSYELDADATPEVKLVGGVLDLAGNEGNAGEGAVAIDRIAPTLRVTADEGDRPVANDRISLTIAADENIAAPNVIFRKIMSRTIEGETTQTLGAVNEGSASVKFVSAAEYRASIAVGANEGLFNVVVEAADAGGANMGRAGDDAAPIDLSDDTDAILFERDRNVPNPDVDPYKDGVQREFSTEDPDTFIHIDFSAEANEYDDNEYDHDEDDATDRIRGDDLDTHEGIAIVSATLDGADISGSLQANDAGNVFLYKAEGLALGDHKLEVVAEDAAGNRHSSPREATIIIKERKPFSLELKPGWNLVSIPGDPEDSDINAVIPPNRADINAALTYDPSGSGQWLGASRGEGGMFEGELMKIAATRAYWIESDSFKSLKVDIPKPSGGLTRIRRTIPIAEGWNMVPILDADGDFYLSFPDGMNYFSSLTSAGAAIEVDTFNTLARFWEGVSPEDVEIGKGYWVRSSKAGTLIP